MEQTKTMDLRKWKSQDALKRSFWQLLLADGYAKLTVRNMTEVSGLNRKTFYRNYADMEALMKAAFFDLFVDIASPYSYFRDRRKAADGEFADCTREYITRILANRDLFLAIYQNHLEGYALEVWKKIFSLATPHYTVLGNEEHSFLEDADSIDLFTNFYTYSTFGHLEWIIRNPDEDIELLLKKTMDTYASFLHTYYVSYGIDKHWPQVAMQTGKL